MHMYVYVYIYIYIYIYIQMYIYIYICIVASLAGLPDQGTPEEALTRLERQSALGEQLQQQPP